MIDKINREFIARALDFYGVSSPVYMEKCLAALDEIKSDEVLRQDFDSLCAELFGENMFDLWKYHSLNELFEEEPPAFCGSVVLLSGYELHISNMERLDFDSEQTEKHRWRMRDCLTLDIEERRLPAIRYSQMMWGAYFTNCRIFEFGRLQYEWRTHDVNVHIPADGKLIFDDVLESVRLSREGFDKYFGRSDAPYRCVSWLLSPQLKELLPAKSNILRFQTLFDIAEGPDCTEEILDFVYKTDSVSDYSALPESTSLQRYIKKYLSDGKKLNCGVGKMLV